MKDTPERRLPMYCNRFTLMLGPGNECNFRFMAHRPAQNDAGGLLVADEVTKEWREPKDESEAITSVLVDDQIIYTSLDTAISLYRELNRVFLKILPEVVESCHQEEKNEKP